jgi:tetratricopeptide (TPR) repeat protein
MSRFRLINLAAIALTLVVASSISAETKGVRKFEWTTPSEEAKSQLTELQNRIERFEAGPALVELGQKIVAADPEFAMGVYYLSAVAPPPDNQAHLDEAVALSKNASDGERRFIQAMAKARANQGANFQAAVPDLEKLAEDYPDERLVFMILGQIYQATNESDKARKAFERALEIGPPSPRARTFIANTELLKGHYAEARSTFNDIAKGLPESSVPFAIRYGVAFSYLYENNSDKAIEALKMYLKEYKASGASQNFPEVFIWNSIARIQLEAGRPEEAIESYKKGYETVPSSSLSEDQKQLWLGRLRHGECRALAKMGKHKEAWAESEEIRKMIDEGGESAQQYMPAYHYLVGYLKLETGELDAAVEHLKKADMTDPFQKLLLARAYDKKGNKEEALKAYKDVVSSNTNGLERALAYPEAKKKLATS